MGRMQFESVVAMAPREILRVNDITDASSVPVSTAKIVDFYSSPGTIGLLQGANIIAAAPVGATGGLHQMVLGNTAGSAAYMAGGSAWGDRLEFNRRYWVIGTSYKEPPSDAAQGLVFQNVVFDSDVGLSFVYSNNTDAVQTGSRNMQLIWIEKTIS